MTKTAFPTRTTIKGTPFLNVQEIKNRLRYRQYYLDEGYPYAIADQRAMDHVFIERRVK